MRSLIQSSIAIFMVVCTMAFPKSIDRKEMRQVKTAVLDYVEGVYEADTARIYRSVHPDLVKRGTGYDHQNNRYKPLSEMDFQQLVNLSKTWNADGSRANKETVREVTVYDVQDQTATAKVVASWGTDYFHLAKINGKWYIMNVLWQARTPKN